MRFFVFIALSIAPTAQALPLVHSLLRDETYLDHEVQSWEALLEPALHNPQVFLTPPNRSTSLGLNCQECAPVLVQKQSLPILPARLYLSQRERSLLLRDSRSFIRLSDSEKALRFRAETKVHIQQVVFLGMTLALELANRNNFSSDTRHEFLTMTLARLLLHDVEKLLSPRYLREHHNYQNSESFYVRLARFYNLAFVDMTHEQQKYFNDLRESLNRVGHEISDYLVMTLSRNSQTAALTQLVANIERIADVVQVKIGRSEELNIPLNQREAGDYFLARPDETHLAEAATWLQRKSATLKTLMGMLLRLPQPKRSLQLNRFRCRNIFATGRSSTFQTH